MSKTEAIETVFNAALQRPTTAERAAYLDGACGDDAAMRQRVEALLRAHDEAGSFLKHPANGPTLTTPALEKPGTRIGRYKLLQSIGEGGFGAVYMAEQEQPVRRMVALKIIKLGMDTKQVIARFEAERQALAMMDHPNIAKVLDAGATETGRPYFVMELVKGIPITEYCDKNKLEARQRLELFVQVCQAIQHAHQKGIIHRDLKPSNVLVTLHDARAVPKVIDFGIAKATSHRLTEKTLFTEFRQFIGTPEYMSPDQAEISGLDVDTRTDIYSLGVLLYELLTGTTPFDGKTLRSKGYGEIQRIIREEEPPKPSTRIITLEQEGTGTDIANHRHSDPRALSRLMRGDLDWIVMKAMEKDRTRRYQTANELAEDIERHLHDQPVVAGPPSVGYKVMKFVHRHRLGVLAAGLIVAALLTGTALSAVGLVQARRQARHSAEVNEFLQQVATRIDVDAQPGAGLSAERIVARGNELFGDDPALIGTLLMTRAGSLNTVGREEEAIDTQRRAIEQYRIAHPGDHKLTAAALSSLGKFLGERRDYAQAEQARREALAMKERLYGPESRQTAEELSELTSLVRELGDSERKNEVKELWARTVDAFDASLGPANRKTVRERSYFGKWMSDNGLAPESVPILEQAYENRHALGDSDMALFVMLQALAQQAFWGQDWARLVTLVEELIAVTGKLWGPHHFITLSIKAQLAGFYVEAEKPETGGRVLREYLQDRRASETAGNLQLVASEEMVVSMMEDWLDDNPEVGRELIRLFVADLRDVRGPELAGMAGVHKLAGEWFAEHGFDEDAEPHFEKLVEHRRTPGVCEPTDLAYALIMLADRKVNLGRHAEAEPLAREALEIRAGALDEEDWLIGSCQSVLGESLMGQGRYDEAEPLLRGGWAVMSRDADTPLCRQREALERLVTMASARGRPEEATTWQAELDRRPMH